METVVTSKGQMVIPSGIRRKLGIKIGTRVLVEPDYEKGTIILKPLTKEYVISLSGKYKDVGLLDILQAAREKRGDKDGT